MAKIGIYGSSFDPITNVHLWTASTVAHRCKLDRVIFLPCSSKRPDKTMSISDEHRWNMIEMAIEGNAKFTADDYEMKQAGWEIATYLTLQHFKMRFPDDEIYFIMGADLLLDIGEGKWKKSEELIQENKFIVMARDGINMLAAISRSPILRNADDGHTFHLIDKGLAMEISSSYIRDEFKRGGEPRYLMPDRCYDYIQANRLYR
ncbi:MULTISPECIES: nicotinate (nicotinamide) nucleotide adenylyltransferase [Paenibacillus]|uniref:Probable nicotinate-nucleotide adenylyltransferase n=1 Tax=Paenibacillus azoreducens TaxID=116718 RepID=A0A919YA38_9BACL|nr:MULTISPECIES: nicotinate (nicotinamide) nucleotide adenylyltransferase [Paenibacillus]MBE9914988.1 nicotinate (nicotinamide) nucleotide adenylyltransferase [Paenibacillus donghaensis]GIO45333.1 putative nicotinate-nucleotide adenylyltransferase [Paenibacillus azoreducens]